MEAIPEVTPAKTTIERIFTGELHPLVKYAVVAAAGALLGIYGITAFYLFA